MMQDPSAEEETKLRLSLVTVMLVTSLRCSFSDTIICWYDECTFHTLTRTRTPATTVAPSAQKGFHEGCSLRAHDCLPLHELPT